jgi:hypothetical protein
MSTRVRGSYDRLSCSPKGGDVAEPIHQVPAVVSRQARASSGKVARVRIRKLLSAISLVATFAVTFTVIFLHFHDGATIAFRATLPIAERQSVSLPTRTKIHLYNMIGGIQASQFGIEPASFDQTRQIRLTDGETMHVVPGTAGVCIVLRQAAGCGNPGVSNRLLGLYVEDKRTGNMIGAGIADASVRRVVASLEGASAVIPVRHGIFLLPAEAGLRQPRVGDLVPPVVRAEPTKRTPRMRP